MTLGQFFFKNRSYAPIPFLIPLFLIGRPTVMSMGIGIIIVLFGEFLRIWGVSYAGSETRTTKVGGTNLVTQGPFSYIRNPLYAGNMIIYLGVGIMGYTLFFPYFQIIGLAYFYFQYYYIIKDEEDFLRKKFKEKYDDYFGSVPSIFPNFHSYELTKQSKIKQNIREALRSEKRTFEATSLTIFLILLIFILIHQ